MTISEMHIAVKLGLDKSSYLTLPAFEPEEIDYWLNVAQRQFVLNRVAMFNDERFIASRSRINSDLSTITRVFESLLTGLTATGAFQNKVYSTSTSLPSNFWLILHPYVSVTRTLEDGTTATNQMFPAQLISPNEVDKYLSTPVNRPYFEKPAIFIGENTTVGAANKQSIFIIIDYYTSSASTFYSTYIRKPTDISSTTSTSCELPDFVHDEIVDIAVRLMTESVLPKNNDKSNS